MIGIGLLKFKCLKYIKIILKLLSKLNLDLFRFKKYSKDIKMFYFILPYSQIKFLTKKYVFFGSVFVKNKIKTFSTAVAFSKKDRLTI